MTELKQYGFTPFFESQTENNDLIPARITAVFKESYKIISEYGESSAKIKGSLYNNAQFANDFPAVGDFVLIKYNDCGDSIINKVLERKSKFSRPDYSGHKAGYVKTVLEQVVAANFDYVFIMVSLNNDFKVNRIQRYLAASWQSGAVPVVVLNKADLVEDYTEQLRSSEKAAIGAGVCAVSAHTGFGLSNLSEYLKPGKTIVFLGSSGVGKSSLVNALAGEDIMKVNEIREDDSRGRHTTTHRQLIKLQSGVMIIDTPGMRELGMWDIGDGLSEAFSDIEELILKCKFSDCKHGSEPSCAIKDALESGSLDAARWGNYRQLIREARFSDDKSGYLKDKQQWGKSISKFSKSLKKDGVIKK